MSAESIVADARYRGFSEWMLGGWVAGVAARGLGPMAAVKLLRPVAPGSILEKRTTGPGAFELRDSEGIVALAGPGDPDIRIPTFVSVPEAAEASRGYPGFVRHLYPECFCCGPAREIGDGLRIFPGPVPGQSLAAAVWNPATAVCDDEGRVRSEVVWAALDCPGLWALVLASSPDSTDRFVTARLALRVDGDIRCGEDHVVVGWTIGTEGKRTDVGAAIFGREGRCLAIARQTCARASWGFPVGRPFWGS